MSLLYELTSFIGGSIVGSFLNVVINRADTGESPFIGRSHCPYCKTPLSWWELIPIISFFILRGKCRHCGKKISVQYPLVELITGLLFAGATWRLGRLPFFNIITNLPLGEKTLLLASFLISLYWISVLIILSVYDWKRYLILTPVLFPATIITFIWRIIIGYLLKSYNFVCLPYFYRYLGENNFLWGNWSYFSSFFWGIISSFVIIALIVVISKEKAMGWGDALLAPFLGMILGWPAIILALMLSFLIGGLVSFILILMRKKNLKSHLPFAPFLTAGTLTIMLFGDIIIKSYLNLL